MQKPCLELPSKMRRLEERKNIAKKMKIFKKRQKTKKSGDRSFEQIYSQKYDCQ